MPGFRMTAVATMLAAILGAVPLGARAEVTASAELVELHHVRALDDRSARLLEAAVIRSATIRTLVTALQQSDVIVYVETGFTSRGAHLAFVGSSPDARFLRITLDVPEAEDRLLALLGHELQHAFEVSEAPEVRSAEALRRLYLQIGHSVSANGVCTAEAQHASAQVAVELAFGPEPQPDLR